MRVCAPCVVRENGAYCAFMCFSLFLLLVYSEFGDLLVDCWAVKRYSPPYL